MFQARSIAIAGNGSWFASIRRTALITWLICGSSSGRARKSGAKPAATSQSLRSRSGTSSVSLSCRIMLRLGLARPELQEAQMALRDAGLECELELREPAPLAPRLQQLRERPGFGGGQRHVTHYGPRGEARSTTSEVVEEAPQRAQSSRQEISLEEISCLPGPCSCSSVIALFGVLSALALRDVGYFGIIAPHFQSWGGAQVIVDLVIVCALGCLWMIEDARARGISPWPFVVATVFTGSFGILFYLVARELRGSAGSRAVGSRRGSRAAHNSRAATRRAIARLAVSPGDSMPPRCT